MFLVAVVTRVIGSSFVLVGYGFSSDLHPIEHPCWIFASCECLL